MFVKILLYVYFLFWVDLLSFLLKAAAISPNRDIQRRDSSDRGGTCFFEGTKFENHLNISNTPR